jgi:glucan phosphoethanolaminetransferase (alkaline phosphatase superfamily)
MKGLKINKILCLLICIIIVTLNVLLEHFYAPHGIDFTPFIVIIVAVLLNVTENKFTVWLRILLTYAFIGMNDVGIKLYGGGMHDVEGQGFVFLFLIVGLIPGFLIVTITVIKDKSLSALTKAIALITFLILLGLHLYLFENLGIGRYYPIYNLS